MLFKDRVLKLLNVHREESSLVSQLFIVQFFLISGSSFLFIVANAIFLSVYPIVQLPVVFFITGIFLFIFNKIYRKAEHLFSNRRLLFGIILVSIVITVAIRLFMSFPQFTWMPYVLLVWYNVVYLLTGLVFWGLAASLFNVRESKRLFTIIGAGDIPAKLLGYLSVSLLAPYIGLPNMIWITIILFGLAFVYSKKMFELSRVKKLASSHEHHKHQVLATAPKQMKDGKRLIFSIAILSLLTFAALILIDFIFLAEVKTKYHTDLELAYFLGLFFAGGRILAALIKFTLSSRFINYVGLTGSLLLSPIVICLLTIFILFTDSWFAGGHWLIFLFGIMALVTEILKTTMQEPIFLVLFQPLKVSLRLRGHIIAKGYMLAAALTIIGGFLYLFITYSSIGTGMALLLVLLGLLVLWVLSIFFVKKEYVFNLRAALERGYLSGNDLFIEDNQTLNLLKKKTESNQLAEAIFALDLLEKANYPQLDEVLIVQLKYPDDIRVRYALDKIVEHRFTGATRYLSQELPNIENPQIAAQFIKAIPKLEGDSGILNTYLHSSIPECKYAAMEGMLMSSKADVKELALAEMKKMTKSNLESDRIAAAEMIGDARHEGFEDTLIRFLHDPSHKVENKAIEAVGKLGAEELIPELVNKLVNRHSRKAAMKALVCFGDAAIDYFERDQKLKEDGIVDYIQAAGDIQSDRAFGYLLKLLFKNPSLTSSIIKELWQHHFLPGDQTRPQLASLVKKRLEEAESVFLLIEGLKSAPGHGACLQALQHEVELRLMDSLKLLNILNDSEKVSGALKVLIHGQEQKSSNALEMLEMSIPRDTFHKLNHVFEVAYGGKVVTKKRVVGVMPALKEIIQNRVMYFNDWTRAMSMKLMGQVNYDEAIHFLKDQPVSLQAPILAETQTAILENRIKR